MFSSHYRTSKTVLKLARNVVTFVALILLVTGVTYAQSNGGVIPTDPTIDLVNWAELRYGTQISGGTSSGGGFQVAELIDGVGSRYTRWIGTSISAGQTINLDLGQQRTISAVELHLYDGDIYTSGNTDRYYRYRVEGSLDGVTWSVLVSRESGEHRGIQRVAFPDVAARYVRVRGTFNSANNVFHLVSELKVLGTVSVAPVSTQQIVIDAVAQGGSDYVNGIDIELAAGVYRLDAIAGAVSSFAQDSSNGGRTWESRFNVSIPLSDKTYTYGFVHDRISRFQTPAQAALSQVGKEFMLWVPERSRVWFWYPDTTPADNRGSLGVRLTQISGPNESLIVRVRDSMTRSILWQQQAVSAWGSWITSTTRNCFGCHIQTQATRGLAESRGRLSLLPVDDALEEQFVDAYARWQLTNGAASPFRAEYVTQTSLWAWAVSALRKELLDRLTPNLFNGLNYLLTRQTAAGGWNADQDNQYLYNDGVPSASHTAGNMLALSRALDEYSEGTFVPFSNLTIAGGSVVLDRQLGSRLDVTFQQLDNVTALKLVIRDSFASNGNFVLSEIDGYIGTQPIPFVDALANFSQANFPVMNSVNGVRTSTTDGWGYSPRNVRTDPAQAVFRFASPLSLSGVRLTQVLGGHELRNFSLYYTTASNPDLSSSFTEVQIDEVGNIVLEPGGTMEQYLLSLRRAAAALSDPSFDVDRNNVTAAQTIIGLQAAMPYLEEQPAVLARAQINAAVTHLRSKQRPDGGWCYAPQTNCPSRAYVSAIVLKALLGTEPVIDEALTRAAEHLLLTQDTDGAWTSLPLETRLAATTQVEIALPTLFESLENQYSRSNIDDLIAIGGLHSVHLTWSPIEGAVGYNLYRRTASSVFQRIATGHVTDVAEYRDLNLPNDITFFYEVRWLAADGSESSSSNEASGTPYGLECGSDTPPVIQSRPVTAATEGVAYRYQVDAIDTDPGDALSYTLAAKPSGMTVDQNGLISWQPAARDVGSHFVRLEVRDRIGRFASQAYRVTVGRVFFNRPPVFSSVPRTIATAGYRYRYASRADDPNVGDVLTYSLTQSPSGMSINSTTGLVQWTPNEAAAGTSVPVEVAVIDAGSLSATQPYSLSVRANIPPEITSTPILRAPRMSVYLYQAQASDTEGGALRWSLLSAPTGMTIGSGTGRILWTPQVSQVGDHTVRIRVLDEAGASDEQEFTLTVPANDSPVFISVPSPTAYVGYQYRYQARVNDPENGIVEVTLTEGQAAGVAFALSTRLTTFTPTLEQAGQSIPVRLRAIDDAGNITEQEWSITVSTDTPPDGNNGGPGGGGGAVPIEITSPARGTVIGAATAIIGTIDDQRTNQTQPLVWTIYLKRGDDEQLIPIGSGTGSVNAGQLALFDPTMLQADSYTLVVRAEGGGFTTRQDFFPYEVRSRVQLGDFSTSATDLVFPMAGMPLSISRAYSSTNTAKYDFGYGWRLQLPGRITDTAREASPTAQAETYNGGTRVFVTLPDGRREGFTFAPYAYSPFFPGWGPAFRPDPGVTSVLETSPAFLVRSGAEYYELFDEYNPSQFTLTTRDRVRYVIHESLGLREMEDANRNRITFSANGFTHSGGESLQITRDSDNRITRVVDPGGREHRYAYNAAGELESYTDPLNQVTRYTYDAFHRLLTITDPAGVVVLRNEYNAEGRLIRQFDALGNQVTVSVDPGTNTQVITDRRGNPTTYRFNADGNLIEKIEPGNLSTRYEYDANFNVTAEINPSGQRQQSVYDARSNLLRTTNPLGHQSRFSYTGNNQVATFSNALGQTTNFTYSNTGLLTRIVDAAGRENRLAYDSTGGITAFIDALNNRISIEYNSSGKPSRLVDALGKSVSISYNSDGKPVETTRLKTNPQDGSSDTVRMQYEYDALGRPVRVTDAEGRVSITVWNRWNKPDSFTDRRGNVFTFEYDNQGQLTRVVYPDGTDTRYTYDADGNRLTETDRTGRVTSWEYDSLGRVTAMVYPGGARTQTEYDLAGNVSREINELGGETRFFYDAANRKIREIDAVGRETLYTYDPIGNLISQTLPTGAIRSHEYNISGDIIRTVEPDGTILRWEYDAAGRMVREINSRGGIRSIQYDANGRILSETDELGNVSRSEYDELGNRVRSIDELGAITRMQYDRVGRLTQRTSPVGAIALFSYDANDNLISERDPLNRTRRMEYDAYDRLIREFNALNQTTVHSYDAEGRKLTVTDAGGRVSRHRYDGRGNLSEFEDALGGISRYFYDAQQNVTSAVDRTGRERQTDYDQLGRPIQERWVSASGVVERSVTKTYHASGNLASESDGSITQQYTYDERDRVISISTTGVGTSSPFILSYQYDTDGNVVAVSDSSGTSVAREVDARGMPVAFSWSGAGGTAGKIEVTHDARGNPVAIERFSDAEGNTLVAQSSVTYDTDARIDVISHQRANGAALRQFDYEYDLASQVIREQTQAGAAQYTYDLIGQVLGVDNSVGTDESFAYDVNGNQTGGGRQYDASNRLTRDATFDYTYNAEGNLTLKRNRATNLSDEFTYDHNQQLTRVVRRQGATVVGELVYRYDLRGRRVMRSLNGAPLFTIFNGDQPWADLDLNGQVVARYLYGEGIDQILAANKAGEGSSFYLTDRLGSVRQRLSSSGDVLAATDYSAFGQFRNTTGTLDRFGFTARESDSFSNLYHYRARQYDPVQGRFTSQDPLRFAAGDTNFYRYAFNAPTMYTDPTGMFVAGYAAELRPAVAIAASQNTALVGAQLQVLEAASAVRTLAQAGSAAARSPLLEVVVRDTRYGLALAKAISVRFALVAGTLGIRGDSSDVTVTNEADGTILEQVVTEIEEGLVVEERRRKRRECDPKNPQPLYPRPQKYKNHMLPVCRESKRWSCFYSTNMNELVSLTLFAWRNGQLVDTNPMSRKYCFDFPIGNTWDGTREQKCIVATVLRDCRFRGYPTGPGHRSGIAED